MVIDGRCRFSSGKQIVKESIRHFYEQEDTMGGDLRAPECKIYPDF